MKTKLLILAISISWGYSTILNIPVDYPTIQAGIDASVDGDTVLVEPGTYFENIDYSGKNITVTSNYIFDNDPFIIEQTIIDGNGSGKVVTFWSGEDSTAYLTGFTITHGTIYADSYSPEIVGGGGVSIRNNSSPTLEYLIVKENGAWGWDFPGCGGGIFVSGNSAAVFKNLVIIENNTSDMLSTSYGAGIFINENSDILLDNVTIQDNSTSYGHGGGLSCWNSNPKIYNCLIIENSASFGGGIELYNSNPEIYNTIIKDNLSISPDLFQGKGGGIYCDQSSNPFLSNVLIKGNHSDFMGGGIYCREYSNLNFDRVNLSSILHNTAPLGAELVSENCPIINVVLDSFSVVNPTDYYVFHSENFSFNINYSENVLVNSDIFVSPDGNDENIGTNPDEPLLTINRAFQKIYVDSFYTNSVYLSKGTFSLETTGEVYPIYPYNYISIVGENRDSTILSGELDLYDGNVFYGYNSDNYIIKNLTIQNGAAWDGGGIALYESSPLIENVKIRWNIAQWGGRCLL